MRKISVIHQEFKRYDGGVLKFEDCISKRKRYFDLDEISFNVNTLVPDKKIAVADKTYMYKLVDQMMCPEKKRFLQMFWLVLIILSRKTSNTQERKWKYAKKKLIVSIKSPGLIGTKHI